jgi:hypothetical protein
MFQRPRSPAPVVPAVPGEPVEMSSADAEAFGAFEETALSEADAAQSNDLPADNQEAE